MSQTRPTYQTTTTNGNALHQVTLGKPTKRYKAYKKIILGAIQFLSGMYELITGETAPKTLDVMTK